jgi:uncharacterized delta-60 repeat protein
VNQSYFLRRFQANGDVDTTFGTGGLILTNFSGTFGGGGPLTIEPNGNILVGVDTFDPVTGQSYMSVAQFTANGALDDSYGTGGVASVSFGGNPNYTFVTLTGMTLQPDGKVVVVGINYSFDPNTGIEVSAEDVMARFTAAGIVDTSFGNGGTVDTGINGSGSGPVALLQKDGAIVIAVSTYDPVTQVYDYVLEAFNSDGTLVFGKHKS